RELLESVQFTPTRGRFKVYIIDEVHMLSTSSFNALLKTLEEPPPHVKFVLATTDAQKIPVTILSRCLKFNLRRLLPNQISDYLEKILSAESVESEPAAVSRISRAADGSMRDGLSLLDQAIAYGGGKLTDEDVANMLGSVDHAHIASMLRAVASADAQQVLELVAELAAQARDLESVLEEVAEVLHRINLVQLAPEYQDPERSDWESIVQLADLLSAEDAQLFYEVAIHGARDLGLAPDPRTGLEMALLRMLAFKPLEEPGSGHAQQKQPATASPPKAAGKAAAPARAKTAESVASGQDAQNKPRFKAPRDSKDWHGLMPKLRLSGPVRELARNIELESCSGDRWQFLIPDSVRHLGSRALVQKLQTELSSQLGQAISLHVHTASEPLTTPAVVGEQASQQRLSEAERAILQDPTVQELQEGMGAEIVKDSIQPLQ
ncbi:MAG: DNA polymerase III subunit gamma/tau, partial [Xanthomonadales bacterium]|nr:DNA polymerase III subunit gamma/tau [Xanthomonadales bacterium]